MIRPKTWKMATFQACSHATKLGVTVEIWIDNDPDTPKYIVCENTYGSQPVYSAEYVGKFVPGKEQS